MSSSCHDGGGRPLHPADRAWQGRVARRTAGAALLLAGQPAWAALPDPAITIAAEAGVTAASNPLLLAGRDTGALLGEASLAPRVSFTTDTGNALDLGGIVTGRRYSRRYGSFLLGGAHATATLREGERLLVTAAASYRRDITSDALTTSVDALAAPQSIRNSWRGEGTVTWRPDSRTMIVPAIKYERSDYARTTVLDGTRAATATLALSRRLSAETWIGIRPLATTSRAGSQPELDQLALFATLDRKLSTAWRLRAAAGIERVGAVHGDDGGVRLDRKAQLAFSGEASLCREGEYLDTCLSASIGSEASAIEGLQRRAAVSLSGTRRLSARSQIAFQFDYQRAGASTRFVARRSLDAQSALLRFERRITAQATLAAELRYARRRIETGGAPDAGFAGIRLRWEPRLR